MIASDGHAAKILEQDAGRTMRQRLVHFMKRTRLSTERTAIACGYKTEFEVRAWLNGKEDADCEGRVADLLGFDDEHDPIATSNVQAIFDLCRYADRRGRIVGMEGRAGYGKSTALRLFARTYGAIYYEYDEVSGPRIVLRELCRLAGLHNYFTLPAGDMLHRLMGVLRANRRLIIVDQADTLPFKALEAIRAIHDTTAAPVVLSGIDGRMRKRLERRNLREDAAQIYSRVSAFLTLNPPTREDIETIAAAHGIKGARAIDYIHRRAAIVGLRSVITLCEDAKDVAEVNSSRTVGLEHLQKAAEYLLGLSEVA